MPHPVYFLLVAVLFGAALGCGPQSADPYREDALLEKSANGTDAGSEPTHTAVDPQVMDKEAEALRAIEIEVFTNEDGIDASLTGTSLTPTGDIRPDVVAALRNATTLRGVDLQLAPAFSDAGLESLKVLPDLRRLHVPGTKVTDTGMVHVGGMKKLEELQLNRTRVTDRGLESLKDIPGLTALELNTLGSKSPTVTNAGLGKIKRGRLQRLDVTGTGVTDDGFALLSDAKNLSVLSADNCDITNRGLEYLKPLTKMSWLKLNNTKITDAGLAPLENCSALLSLEVRGTAVTKVRASQLQAKLTNCSIDTGDGKLDKK